MSIRDDIGNVTYDGVIAAMQEHDRLGKNMFLNRYGFRLATKHFVLFNDEAYSSKAVLAVGHKYSGPNREALSPKGFGGGSQTIKALKRIGFNDFTSDIDVAKAYTEGKPERREVTFFWRNPQLVRDAKTHHGSICQTCGFDFHAVYGSFGEGYIECHHIEPLSEGQGKARSITINDVAVLCANCHRMIHRRRPALSLEELRKVICAG